MFIECPEIKVGDEIIVNDSNDITGRFNRLNKNFSDDFPVIVKGSKKASAPDVEFIFELNSKLFIADFSCWDGKFHVFSFNELIHNLSNFK